MYNYCIKNTKKKEKNNRKKRKKDEQQPIHTPPIVFVKDVQVKVVGWWGGDEKTFTS